MEHGDFEYQPFGEGWVRRAAGSTADWQHVERDDVPGEVVTHFAETLPRRQALVAQGIHPDDGKPGPEIRRVSEGEAPFED